MWSASTSRRRARRSSRRHARRPKSRRCLRRMAMQGHVGIFMTVVVLALTLTGVGSVQASHDIVLGFQCDRTGATQTVGVVICPGYHDYVNLVNANGGVMGHRLRVDEVDHEYKVPAAIESYERFKKAGAVVIGVYGTPQIYALTQKLTEDRIPGTSPGFGKAAAADGSRYPSIFPIAATYWSQATAAVKFVKDQLSGSLKGKKIGFLFYDNPAGREPIPILEDLSVKEGFQLKTFAVPPPGVEMGAQVLDIAQRYRAGFLIAHLFGRSPSVSIKELKRVGFPLRKVASFVWGAAEADIEAAGGYALADGYYGLQFAGVGQDFPVINEIREMYKKQGKEAPKEMASTVYANPGLLHMLSLNNIEVIYDDVILVLKGVSLSVREGGITTLLGANGAGKSTTLKAISGLLRAERGEVTKGSIEFKGERIDRLAPHEIVRRGIVQVFEGRRVFEHLTTEENLIAGAHVQPDRRLVQDAIVRVYEYFPRLKERRSVQAGYLSGGEQQMLVIGRALMAKPHVMLLDDPSLGLAPMLVEEIFAIVREMNRREKLTVLLVEQNAALALQIAEHGYVMENGRLVLDGPAAALRENADIKEFYLGLTEVGARKSYRDVKHYKRRKRWLS